MQKEKEPHEKRHGYKKAPAPAIKRATTPTSPYATHELGPDGGEIHLSGAGLRVIIPKGALKQTHRFDVSAHRSVHGFTVNMEPHAPLAERATIVMDLDDAAVAELRKGPPVLGCTNMVDDVAVCHELYAVSLQGNVATARVPHFSGYMMGCGFYYEPCNPATDGPTCVWVDDT